MYKVKVNGGQEYELAFSRNDIVFDGTVTDWDKLPTGKNQYHILRNGRSYRCEVVSADYEKNIFEIRVNGSSITVEVKGRLDELLTKMGMDKSAEHRINNIKAPMPGLVVKILVEEGQQVKVGESILILEAMKMENVLKSPGDGVIKLIKIRASDAVEKNQVLVEFK